MPTEEKAKIIKGTSERFKKSAGVYFTKYTGINVQTITQLRKSFRDNQVEYVVTKNTLTKLSAKEVVAHCGRNGILIDYLNDDNDSLFQIAVTEKRTKNEIDLLVQTLKDID